MRYLYSMLLVVSLTSGLSSSALAEDDPVILRFSTAGIGSGSYVYAAGMSDMVGPHLPEGSIIDTVPGTGSVGSMKKIQAGDAELATTHAVVAAEGCGGFGAFAGDQHDKVTAVVGGLDRWYYTTFVTEQSDVQSWDEIVAGKNDFHLLIVPPGGAGYEASKSVMRAMGTSLEEMEAAGRARSIARAPVPQEIRDGNGDGWAHIVPAGHPVGEQLVTINDMNVIPLPDHVIEETTERGYAAVTIPPGTWRGQPEPIRTIGTGASIVAHADVPEHAIYTFTKTIMENADGLGKIHAALKDFNPDKSPFAIDCPLHPGAAKYYKEIGLIE